jgi:hypothetical protein
MHTYTVYVSYLYTRGFADHAVRPGNCAAQFCDVVVLRSHVPSGEGWRDGPAELGVLYVRFLRIVIVRQSQSLLYLMLTDTAARLHTYTHMHRWAIGLFLYQTLDAIDGCVLFLRDRDEVTW